MTSKTPKFSTCPLCGSERIKFVQTEFVLRLGSKAIRIPRLPRHECPVCSEKFFDYAATKRIEAARQTHRLSKAG